MLLITDVANMAENCSNVGAFTASLDKAFHKGIILGACSYQLL